MGGRPLEGEARLVRSASWRTDDLAFEWTPSQVATPAQTDLDFCWRAEAALEEEDEFEIPSSYIYYIDFDDVHETGF